jgi:hypothetical protein
VHFLPRQSSQRSIPGLPSREETSQHYFPSSGQKWLSRTLYRKGAPNSSASSNQLISWRKPLGRVVALGMLHLLTGHSQNALFSARRLTMYSALDILLCDLGDPLVIPAAETFELKISDVEPLSVAEPPVSSRAECDDWEDVT